MIASFIQLAKMDTSVLENLLENDRISKRIKRQIQYELRIRKIELPKEWKL